MTAAVSGARSEEARSQLPRIIGGNGWFSLVSGVALVAGAFILDDWFVLPAWVIAFVGAALIPYGLMLRAAASAEPFDVRMAWLATIGDLAWVGAAIVLIAIPDTMSTAGKWTLAAVSLAVLDFAILQLRGLVGGR